MAKPSPAPTTPRADGPWLLLKWLIPLFAIVFLVNGVMIYKAQTTFNGLTTEHAYEKGLAYNTTLQQQAAQAALGWAFQTQLTGRQFQLIGLTKEGSPLTGATIAVTMARPTHTGEDKTFTLTPSPTAGTYQVAFDTLAAGQWEATFTVTRPHQNATAENATADTFVIHTRLILP